MTNSLFILAVLCLVVVVSEFLVRRTVLKHLGTALVVIILTAIVANLTIIPAGSTAEAPVPVYDGIFGYIAPLAIFWLLLSVNLKDVIQAGGKMIGLFAFGAVGTTVGVLVAMWAVDGPTSIGELYAPIGGMFTGTYIGGSINFNAVGLHYDVMRDGLRFGGAVVVDNIATAVWMVITLAIPRLLGTFWKRRMRPSPFSMAGSGEVLLGIQEDTEAIHPVDLGMVLFLGLASVWASDALAAWTASLGAAVPSILILTAIALVLAQFPFIVNLKGAKMLGLFAVYIFLAVIGAFCDFTKLADIGSLGVSLMLFATIVVLIHGVVILAGAWLIRADLKLAMVASQANVGGGTSALAIARSLGRADLVLPGILMGALGNAVGTFVGFWVAGQALPWLLG